MTRDVKIKWLSRPEEHDYPAALSYLSLIFATADAAQCVDALRASGMVTFKAKDIFRASTLTLLGVSNSHIEKVQSKIADGEALSPLLLVRDAARGKVIVADGYHRLCAVYRVDEDALVPCKIAGRTDPATGAQ